MVGHEDVDISVAEVVDFLRVTGRFRPAVRELVERKLAVAAAKRKGLRVTAQELQKAADTFRLARGLKKASATEAWLRSNGLSVEVLEDYLETTLLIIKLVDTLESKTAQRKYLSCPAVREAIRGMIYQDWLGRQMK